MRRSTLQRKDRGELNQIATALGAKPSSRARKDEIIQLIIDLTADGARMTAPASAEQAPDTAPNGLEALSGPSASQEGDAANGDNDRRPSDAANGDGHRRRGNGQQGAAHDRHDLGNPSERLAAEPRDYQRSTDRGDDEIEPGNRRRKRRSRDRDRDRDEGWEGDPMAVAGRLDLRDEGYGFLRVEGCLPHRNDAYVPVKTIRQFGLRRGDQLAGTSRPANRAEKNPALLTLESINGGPAEFSDRPLFENLTPIHAVRHLALEQPDNPGALSARLVDLAAPIGVGQRVLVKGARHSGAVQLLMSIIEAIEANEPDIYVMALFLDQRPEDITEVQRCVRRGEVGATSFDQSPDEHVQTAEMTVERAKRLAEAGRDVVVVLDGLTSLAQAYNAVLSSAGRTHSASVDGGAVHMPRKLFGTGRNISDGGSLTMIASLMTAGAGPLVSVVCDEFEGTANTEIVLDRWAAELDISPALDVGACRSRDESKFLDDQHVQSLQRFRRDIIDSAGEGPSASVNALRAAISKVGATSANAELLR